MNAVKAAVSGITAAHLIGAMQAGVAGRGIFRNAVRPSAKAPVKSNAGVDITPPRVIHLGAGEVINLGAAATATAPLGKNCGEDSRLLTSITKSLNTSKRSLTVAATTPPNNRNTASPEDEKPADKKFNYKRALGITATAAAAGTLAFAAAPVVIPAAVTALGFGSGGIVAGSTAASLMSLGGGMTPVAVSAMQSIGATSAISSATATVTGITAGTTAGSFVAYVTKKKKKNNKSKTN